MTTVGVDERVCLQGSVRRVLAMKGKWGEFFSCKQGHLFTHPLFGSCQLFLYLVRWKARTNDFGRKHLVNDIVYAVFLL